MNWTKTSAIAEIISSVAILATLGYLAVQTQQNTAAIVSSSRQQSLNSEMELLRMVLDHPETDFGAPISVEATRENMVHAALLRTREHLWLQFQEGLLDEELWEAYLVVLVENLQRNEPLRQRWDGIQDRGLYASGFIAAVNEALGRVSSQSE